MPRRPGPGPAAGVPAPTRPEPAWSVPLPVGPAIWASLAVVSLVVMAELNRLAADVLDASGASWSFSDVFGVSRALSPWNGAAAWGAWEALGRTTSHVLGSRADVLVRLLDLHVLADVLFILAYTGLAGSLLRSSPWAVALVRALALADLLEDSAAFALGLRIHDGHATPGWPEHLIGVVTTVKWLLALSALIGAVLVGTGWVEVIRRQLVDPKNVPPPRSAGGRSTVDLSPSAAVRSGTGPGGAGPAGTGGPGAAGAGTAPLRPVLPALWLQRFSLIALVPLAVLAVGPGGETLDQFPDVARSWTDGPTGLRYLGWACAGLGLLVATLLTLGRLRSDRVWRERACAVRRLADPAPGLWVAVPVLVGLLGLVARLAGQPVNWTPLKAIAVTSGVVLIVSWALGRTDRGRWVPVYGSDLPLARATLVTGDVLALSAVVVAGLGLVRAYIAPAAVGGAPADWLLVLLGTASAVVVWPVGEWLRGLLARRPGHLARRPVRRLWEVLTPGKGLDIPTAARRGMTGLVRFRQGVRLGLAAVAGCLLLAVGAVPVWAAHTFGVLACAQLAITALVLLLGVVVVVSRDHLPLPVFRWLGLRSTPVVTLMAVAALMVSYQASDPGLHGVQGIGRPGVTAPDARPTLADAFSGWLSRSSACDVTLAAGPGTPPVTVRPVLFVAADGGGIRAAYWTASAMSAIARDGGACGPHVTLLSSGVSGGSLGLMLSQTTADPMRAVRRLADQDALSAAGLGLLVRDNLASLTGSQLPSWLSGGLSAYPSDRWQDRAALMEGIWQHQAPQLGGRFLAERPGAVTGSLVLNSTSVGTACRVLVSQLRFPASRQSAGGTGPLDPACRSGAAPLPATFDLLADYAAAPGRSAAGCLGDLSAATAVMLSARFAYVTPSGVAGPCGPFSSQQLVDGGYAESTGLGTLVDLAGGGQAPSPPAEVDGWATLIRQHNAGAMAQLLARTADAGGSGSRPPVQPAGLADASAVFLVPMVVFLQNHFRSDVVPSTSRQTSELLVPMDGKAAGAAQATTATLLQRLITLTAPDVGCPPAGPAVADAGADRAALCAEVTDALRQRVPYPVVVVSPDTQPSVTAPLGWVLSRISRQGLDATMAGQAQTTCAALGGTPPHRQSPDCQAGYGRLADLLAVLRGGT